MTNRFPIPGVSNDSSSLSYAQLELFKHLSYNALLDQVEVDVALSTTLHTFRLSHQWSMSSGDTTLVFGSTALDSQLMPLMQGIKNYTKIENHTVAGIIRPYAKVYSDDVSFTGLRDGGSAIDPEGEAVPYEGITELTSNLSVYAVSSVSAEAIPAGTKLRYKLWQGEDDTGDLILSQYLVTTEDHDADFPFTLWWSNLAEGQKGTSVFARATIEPPGEEERVVLARPNQAGGHWNSLAFRTFTTEEVVLEPALLATERLILGKDNPNGLHLAKKGFIYDDADRGILTEAEPNCVGIGRSITGNFYNGVEMPIWSEADCNNTHDLYWSMSKLCASLDYAPLMYFGSSVFGMHVSVRNSSIKCGMHMIGGGWQYVSVPLNNVEWYRIHIHRTPTTLTLSNGIDSVTMTSPTGWEPVAINYMSGPYYTFGNAAYVKIRHVESYLGTKGADGSVLLFGAECAGLPTIGRDNVGNLLWDQENGTARITNRDDVNF